jgi:hypothetical protein
MICAFSNNIITEKLLTDQKNVAVIGANQSGSIVVSKMLPQNQ